MKHKIKDTIEKSSINENFNYYVYSFWAGTVKEDEFLNIKNYTYIYENETLTKNEVSHLKDKDHQSYICRNDVCVRIDSFYYEPYIEFPDENGNIRKYILPTTMREDIAMDESDYSLKTNEGDRLYFKCNTDSDCLSNKCLNYVCIFNEQTSLTGCNSYTPPRSIFGSGRIYMHCGKLEGARCTTDDECSWDSCREDMNVSTCRWIGFPNFSSRNDQKGVNPVIPIIVGFIIMIMVISIFNGICCYYCFRLSNYIKLNRHS
ncbi:hypothetical protein LY90DRAFT_517736 [Neocallimastix californiae]|uniref:Uncharacterized protein n=1 Tax=Neocallimastix californiae TaxID=1754190 RepID=A0A1Y2A305_9FUNG|nr:hypothetical protein LY90DRAFT_517736 [Neocallimastix californiae]|eukprot:ORY16687.1 hypothetical protein LY90DRAFT_517736 [Neocallimastix californiae]